MPLYTVYKCVSSNNDQRIGALHYSDDADSTLCGKSVDSMWYIADNTFTGVATCKACIDIEAQSILPQRADAEQADDSSCGRMLIPTLYGSRTCPDLDKIRRSYYLERTELISSLTRILDDSRSTHETVIMLREYIDALVDTEREPNGDMNHESNE